MDRHRPGSSSRDEGRGKTTVRNKENPSADQVYLVQNENQVLRMKNQELNIAIRKLQLEVNQSSGNISRQEVQLQSLRSNIRSTTFKEDIEIEKEKKLLVQKLNLLQAEEQMMLRKIRETREVTIFEQQKIAAVQSDRKAIEVDILSMRAQNEGTKIILRNIESQNQELRAQNEALVGKRKINQPKERQVSLEIEERIRVIKTQQQTLKTLKKHQTTKLIEAALGMIYLRKMKENLMRIDRYGLLRKIAQKKVIQLALLRKKYLLHIKNQTLQKLRSGFKPLKQQETAQRIIQHTRFRRAKAAIWFNWRRVTKQRQYEITRRFQVQNLFDKLTESFQSCNVFSCFNTIKHFRNKAGHQKSADIIGHIFTRNVNRTQHWFFSCLRQAEKKRQIQLQIDASSKEQSVMLVKSLYLSAWWRLAKARRIESRNLKFRIFKQLKKALALKRRRVLGQMLVGANSRINQINTQSKIFTDIKKKAIVTRENDLEQEHALLVNKSQTLGEEMVQMREEKKCLYQQLALLKVSRYLKTKVQRAFDIWRLRQQQSKCLLRMINMVQNKKTFDKNFGFSKILKKRFAMLKKSIREKIASCEFSYNYLLEQNRHIKEVLDKKQHELEKSKFVKILQRLMKAEKEAKLKYFYKFMRSGFKYWKFRKTIQRMEIMTNQKLKVVFVWLLKQNMYKEKSEERMESYLADRDSIMDRRMLRKGINGFINNAKRNSRLKRVIGGVFERNLELDFYVAFGKIRNEEHLQNRHGIREDITEIEQQIEKINAASAEEEARISVLTNRLNDKQDTLYERKLLNLYRFFARHVVLKVGSCIQTWHGRVKREDQVKAFAKILQRKSRTMLKQKFVNTINNANEDYTVGQLQQKKDKLTYIVDHMAGNHEKFMREKEAELQRMKNEVDFFKKEGQMHEKKSDWMTNIKIKSHRKEWGKKMLGFVFLRWRDKTVKFHHAWAKLDNRYRRQILEQAYKQFKEEVQYELKRDRLRHNLSRIYHKSFVDNAGLGFRIWHFVSLKKNNQLWTDEEWNQMHKFQGLENRYRKAVSKHNSLVDFRAHDSHIRTVFSAWKHWAEQSRILNQKQRKVESIIERAAQVDILKIMRVKHMIKIEKPLLITEFKKKWKHIRMRSFFKEACSLQRKQKLITRLFINKFCPFIMLQAQENILSAIKNYANNQVIVERTSRADKIIQVIETYEKKRKDTLNQYWRRWRRNQFLNRIDMFRMRKVTRHAMNWRVRDIYYAWKLETEAKRVKQHHEEEGEVRKRIIEISRLKLFLQDFKKEKGLLLQNQGGQLVMSPRFQEKKEQQIKSDNNLRYRFISRLILSMNGFSSAVKGYNNLRMYMLLRQKYKKYALMARNNLRKPHLYYAFRIWHKATQDFNQNFQTMERKDLIKVLNKQKDKMEMEYSKKVNLQEKIQQQMALHKILAHQDTRKERLSMLIFIRNYRKVKLFGLLTWRQRVSEMREVELRQMEHQNVMKMQQTEEQVNDLEQLERELRSNNLQLEQAVREAVDIAEMVKRITEERDKISELISQKQFTCESLQEQNEQLNGRLYQAQKQAMNLLIISGENLSSSST